MDHHFTANSKGVDVIAAFPHQAKHKTFVISGIEKDDLASTTAELLAQADAAALILIGKSHSVTHPVIEHLNSRYPKVKVIFITADLGNLASVREAADKLCKLQIPIEGIVANPTLCAAPYVLTADGIESHFQVNYLSHFVLVNHLIQCMPEGGRVVVVSSSIRPEATPPWIWDVNFANGANYHPMDGYAQSMFANVLFAKQLAKSCAGRGISAFSINPGNTKNSLQTYASPEQIASWLQKKQTASEDLPLLLQQAPRSLQQGSATILRALLDPELEGSSGAFLDNCQVVELPNPDFPACAEALWQRSEEILGKVFKWD